MNELICNFFKIKRNDKYSLLNIHLPPFNEYLIYSIIFFYTNNNGITYYSN